MYRVKATIRFLIFLTKITEKRNLKPAYCLLLVNSIVSKLASVLTMDLKLKCIPRKMFSTLVMKHLNCNDFHVDDNLYVLCNSELEEKSRVEWYHLVHRSSSKKYTLAAIFTDEIPENLVYLSESLKLNATKHLSLKNSRASDGYFLVPGAGAAHSTFATEVKVSMISGPRDASSELTSGLLQSYFSAPKYLRVNDVFRVSAEEHAPETRYCLADCRLGGLHFRVNSVRTDGGRAAAAGSGGFVVYGRTTLLQEADVKAYLPPRCPWDAGARGAGWPPALAAPLEQLRSCILPFLQQPPLVDVRPVFLVEGRNGSGKRRLVRAAAESLGLNLAEADFAEVQSLTSAQTEAKLRIILHDALACTPCVLLLRNVQIFGVNAEGQRDERVLAAFGAEAKRLYSRRLEFPLIIVATSTEPEIPLDGEKTFTEKIGIGPLGPEQRRELLAWCATSRGLRHEADLDKVAGACSDFGLADLEALVMHATKHLFRRAGAEGEAGGGAALSTDDFDRATEYMQSIFADQIGAPRVPRVRWEDVGGLAELKREIARRVEMPLLNVAGLGKSGLLLYGPPGTGKTLLAKAVATECQLHFLSVKGPELLNMYVGQSEKNVRQVFERARAAAPCVIFFDELDALAPNRGQSGDSGGVMDRVVSQLLAEMDGLEGAGRVFVVGATNRPDLVDPALLRPGRFDKMLYVGVCADPESRAGVLRALTRQFNLEPAGPELEGLLARLPRNLTGADLYSVASGAWLRAVRRLLAEAPAGKAREELGPGDVLVKLEDFARAGAELVPSVGSEELARYEKLRNELSAR